MIKVVFENGDELTVDRKGSSVYVGISSGLQNTSITHGISATNAEVLGVALLGAADSAREWSDATS